MSGRIKVEPADFVVQEILDISFDGQGEHLYIRVRKCGLNTNDVVQFLQKAFGCNSVDIGLSGLKDKNAITDQWFSIRTPKSLGDTNLPCELSLAPSDRPEDSNPDEPERMDNSVVSSVAPMSTGTFCVLEQHRHSRKLRRGAHRGNRFNITVRDAVSLDQSAPLDEALDTRLRCLQASGFANYFGPQRFGIGYQNLPAAERLFANPKRKISRSKRSLLISAARSQLFNHVCAERVSAGSWNKPLRGEPMLLDGSHSFFINDIAEKADDLAMHHGSTTEPLGDILKRCQRHDIHPSGPLWGRGDTLADAECKQFENGILQLYTGFCEGLENAGLKQQRRALRAKIDRLHWRWQNPSIVNLEFNLLKGVYATSFLSEFMIN